jgi:chemotaxis protein methyltransferase CheR
MILTPPQLIDAIRVRLGLVFPDSRTEGLRAGVGRAMAALHEDDANKLAVRVLGGDEGAIDVLARELTIGETYFFREPQHFEFLRAKVLAGRSSVRLWSAGCSSGEEAYSLAIAALESGVTPEVIATDVNEAALARARAGVYGAWSFRGVPDSVRREWFTQEGRHFRIRDRLKRYVHFGRGNLVDGRAAPRGVDGAFCRNVLIYFDAEGIRAAAHTLHDSLVDGGYLLTGPSDPLLEIDDLQIELHPGLIAHRRGREVPAPKKAPLRVEPPPPVSTTMRRAPVKPIAAPPPAEPVDPLVAIRALADAGDAGRALALLEDFLREPQFDPDAWLLRATLRQEQGDDAGALEDLRRAILLDRSSSIAHTLMASSLRRLGDAVGAERALARARRSRSA